MMIPYLPIVPQVATFEPEDGVCRLAGGLDWPTSSDVRLPGHLPAQIEDWLPRFRSSPDAQASPVVLRFSRVERPVGNGKNAVDESYRLSITSDSITAEAASDAGLFYAFQSIRQAVEAVWQQPRPDLPTGTIEDHPRFPWRGAMLDSARHLQSIDWIKGFLDRMAALKLNRFHWHLTDDEGWRAEIRRHPELTDIGAWRGQGASRYGGYFTQQQMREIVAYAKARHIQVIPEIEMPGHCNAALAANPGLACTDEAITILSPLERLPMSERPDRRAFCAANENVYRLITDVLTELADIFEAPYLHIGGDETPRVAWQKCPRCQELMKQQGYTTTDELRTHFLRRVHEIAGTKLNRTTIAWTEKVRDDLPKDQLTHAWFPGEAAAAARLGRATINSNHEWTYLDYPISSEAARYRPDWMIVLPLEKVYHFDPLPEGLEANLHHLVLGSEAPMWTEYTPDEASLEKQIMPRLAAFAEAVWSPRLGRSFDGFLARWAEVSPLTHTCQPAKTPIPATTTV
ncbi:beta-N-acetylhexosaminidase [Mucisphaera sp.]|uniref:beta-N-acetylhexosaminidase n=1 Tax=Mucisphaera sp. TaxID=2913024 RepID=UPI003D144FD2